MASLKPILTIVVYSLFGVLRLDHTHKYSERLLLAYLLKSKQSLLMLGVKFLLLIFYGLGYTQQCSGLIPGSLLKDHSLQGSEDPKRY